MRGSVKILTLRGISVYLHFTLLLLVLWMVAMYILSGMQPINILWSLLMIIAFFASITVHEYAHALVAARYGIMAHRITLYPIGGIASMEKLPDNPGQELAISAAGPLVSLVLAAALLLFAGQSIGFGFQYRGAVNASNFLPLLAWFNFVLAIFNLIPAFPMDGGRILRALLALRFNYLKATVIAAMIGRVFAFLFIVAGLFLFNFLLTLIGIFILLFAHAEESNLRLKTMVKGMTVRDTIMFDYSSLPAQTKVNDTIAILDHNQAENFVILLQDEPIGVLPREEIMKAIGAQQYDVPVAELLKEDPVFFDSSLPLDKALDQLSGHEEKVFPVMDNNKFIGIISLKHIIEYLVVHRRSVRSYGNEGNVPELV